MPEVRKANTSTRSQRSSLRLPLVERTAKAEPRSVKAAGLWVGLLVALCFIPTEGRVLLMLPRIAALAGVLWLAYRVLRARAQHSASASGWVTVDDEEVARLRASSLPGARGKTTLARWDAPFGMSVLATAARDRALCVFTTEAATRFVALSVESPRDADVARDLLEHAVTVPDTDLAPLTADGMVLEAPSARALFEEVRRRQPQALSRFYLSDASGAAIAATPGRLSFGDKAFDLTMPVEWRVFTFHEGEPGAASLYQATSIRQAGNEVTIVCRAPADLTTWSLGRVSDAPPDRASRVAIDSLFMTPLRAVLEQAPRVPRQGTPPSRSRGRAIET
jgi:hypothetical protein